MKTMLLATMLGTYFLIIACEGGGISAHGKESTVSSSPINKSEEREYKKALIRCHKTGGSRIVKISNKLRCF